MKNTFGTYLRRLREQQEIPLRRFALRIGMDPSNYSKIERGEVSPPTEATLAKIAEGLGISVVTDEWVELKCHADVGRGEVPVALLEREDALAGLLPAFFAQLHKERVETMHDVMHIYKAVAAGESQLLGSDRPRGGEA